MLLDDIKQLKTGSRDLRKFGWLVGAVFTALGLVFFARHKAHYPWFLWPGVTLLILGTFLPRSLKPVYIAWMSLAILMGFVVSNVVLTLFFFFVIAPTGLVARLLGKDFLRLKIERQARSYWLPCSKKSNRPPSDYEKQF